LDNAALVCTAMLSLADQVLSSQTKRNTRLVCCNGPTLLRLALEDRCSIARLHECEQSIRQAVRTWDPSVPDLVERAGVMSEVAHPTIDDEFAADSERQLVGSETHHGVGDLRRGPEPTFPVRLRYNMAMDRRCPYICSIMADIGPKFAAACASMSGVGRP
jgi:hypothetical protein